MNSVHTPVPLPILERYLHVMIDVWMTQIHEETCTTLIVYDTMHLRLSYCWILRHVGLYYMSQVVGIMIHMCLERETLDGRVSRSLATWHLHVILHNV